jgi:transcriptional regulator with XRE-family HTH domain
MFVRRKSLEQSRARELRAAGLSLRQIARELNVALASVSVWVRDVPLPNPAPAPLEVIQLPVLRATDFRTCGSCRKLLPLTRFNRNKGGYQYWCRECFATYFKSRGQRHRDQVERATLRRRAIAKEFIADYLSSHPCRDCGEHDPAVLEFDHVGRKRGNISILAAWGTSLNALRREIGECEVVCVNCHRRRTYRRLNSWRLDPTRIASSNHARESRARNLWFIHRLLSRSACVDCGCSDLLVLEFDHVRGRKVAPVMNLVRAGASFDRLRREIRKCEVRCANCHRRRTRITPLQLELAA